MNDAENFKILVAQLRGGQMHAIWLAQALFYLLTTRGNIDAEGVLENLGKGLNELEDYLANPANNDVSLRTASSVHHQRLEMFRSHYRDWAIDHGFFGPKEMPSIVTPRA